MKRHVLFIFALTLTVLLTSCGGGGGGGVDEDVSTIVQAGMANLQTGNGTAAASNFQEALSRSPNNAEANFGMGFIKLMRISNDLVNFLSAQNDPAFRNVSWLILKPLVEYPSHKTGLPDLGRLVTLDDEDVKVDDLTLEQIRQKLATTITSIEEINGFLNKVISATSGNDTWKFIVLKDWNDPSAGTTSLWRGDVILISSALDFVAGFMHLTVAYSPGPLGVHMNDDGTIEITGKSNGSGGVYEDTNLDGYIDLNEIAAQEGLPDGFGVLASGGSGHLSKTVEDWRSAITKFRDGMDSYLASNTPTDHWAFEDMTQEEYNDFKEDWSGYLKAYANDMIAVFTNGTTLSIRPGLLADKPDLADDPGADFTLKINFAAFFNNLPTDLRNFPIRFKIDMWGELFWADTVSEGFTDTTLLGLFPDGCPQDVYDIFPWAANP